MPEDQKDQWDAIEWDDQGNVPTEGAAEAVNRWLFNTDIVDKVLEDLMQRGQKGAGGDRLGKTIIFVKSRDHAVLIQQRFDINYPHLNGHFARAIDFQNGIRQRPFQPKPSHARACDCPKRPGCPGHMAAT